MANLPYSWSHVQPIALGVASGDRPEPLELDPIQRASIGRRRSTCQMGIAPLFKDRKVSPGAVLDGGNPGDANQRNERAAIALRDQLAMNPVAKFTPLGYARHGGTDVNTRHSRKFRCLDIHKRDRGRRRVCRLEWGLLDRYSACWIDWLIDQLDGIVARGVFRRAQYLSLESRSHD